ncbi:MAG: hemopexin repeat-containing protein [Pseudomonadales bacterium]
MSSNIILYLNNAFGDLSTNESRAAVNHPTSSNLMYFFKGSQYYLFNWSANNVESGYPTSISSGWPSVPSDIDAAVNHPTSSNITYFFKGSQYYRFNWSANNVDPGYPTSISSGWPGVPSDIDAAVGHAYYANIIYCFKDSQYYRFNRSANNVDPGYPRSISSGWLGVPDNIDGAVAHPTDSNLICFIQGNDIYRYSLSHRKVIEPTSFLMRNRDDNKKFLAMPSLSTFTPNARSNGEQYMFLQALDEYYIIIRRLNPDTLEGYLLQVEAGGTTLSWDANKTGNDNQLWKVEDAGNGYKRLVNKAENKAICIEGSEIKMKVVTENDNKQNWYLIPMASNYTYNDFLNEHGQKQISLIVPNIDNERIFDEDIDQLPSLAGVPARPDTNDGVMQGLVLGATVLAVVVATVVTAGAATGLVAVGLTVGAGAATTAGNAVWLFWPTDGDAQWEAIDALYENFLNTSRFDNAKNKIENIKLIYDDDINQIRITLNALMDGSATAADIDTASDNLNTLHDDLIQVSRLLDNISSDVSEVAQLGDIKAVMGLSVKYALIHSRIMFAMRLVSDEYNGSASQNESYQENLYIRTFLSQMRNLVVNMIKKHQELESKRYEVRIIGASIVLFDVFFDGNRLTKVGMTNRETAETWMRSMQVTIAATIHGEDELYRMLFNGIRKSLYDLGIDQETHVDTISKADTKYTVV